jgi:ATP-dependent helicase/nuclease subunit B
VSAAPPFVYTIPPHRGFADALAAGLIARHGRGETELARGIVLLPNNRAARAVSDAFVRRSGGGLLLPRLVPIGDSTRSRSRRRSIRSSGCSSSPA